MALSSHLVKLSVVIAALIFFLPNTLLAAEITVNTTTDIIGDDGSCSLREAVIAANSDSASGVTVGECSAGSGTDTVILGANTYTLTIAGGSEQNSVTGDLDLRTNMTIRGTGSVTTIIDGGGSSGTLAERIFDVPTSGVTISIEDLTIQNGYLNSATTCGGSSLAAGAGICTDKNITLTLVDAVVTANTVNVTSSWAYGGGISFSGGGTLTLTNSTVSNNSTVSSSNAQVWGGGIFISSSSLTATDSVITNNTALATSTGTAGRVFGGGIAIYYSGNVSLTDTTISGNTAISYGSPSSTATLVAHGGGIAAYRLSSTAMTMSLSGVTVSGNVAQTAGRNAVGGGIYNSGLTVSVLNSTLSGNEARCGLSTGSCNSTSHYAYGGAFYNSGGTVNLSNSTIAANQVVAYTRGLAKAGGIYGTSSSTTTVKSTILANNTVTAPTGTAGTDCYGTITSSGYNLIEQSDSYCSYTATTGDVAGVDPGLGGLQDNGGLTDTMAISANDVIDGGSCTSIVDLDGDTAHAMDTVIYDQRGELRDDGDGLCDIGAYELIGTDEICTGGLDEDADRLADCDDADCTSQSVCGGSESSCSNTVDDDGDGSVDCNDTDCTADVDCIDTDGDGYSEPAGDCNDANADVSPAASETCNHIDDDCDGSTDEGTGDNDGDGTPNCSDTETCDGIDNDGDNTVDEDVTTTYYADADGDNFGSPTVTTQSCSEPAGYVSDATDCNDASASVNTGITEVCEDGIDQNCDGMETSCPLGGGGAGDDETESVAYIELDCSNGSDDDNDAYADCLDSNCSTDGYCTDDDGDGLSEYSGDCDDDSATTLPGVSDACGDGIDQDCDGGDIQCESICSDELDNDSDGVADCYDSECGNDSNCLDNDTDGYNENEGDCNDTNRSVNPVAAETCGDDRDQDCDGADLICISQQLLEIVCSDGHDNDGDGVIDCSDSDCTDDSVCSTSGSGGADDGGIIGATESNCVNGSDDDNDGEIDCADLDCLAVTACQTSAGGSGSRGAESLEQGIGGCSFIRGSLATRIFFGTEWVVAVLFIVMTRVRGRCA